MSTKNVQSNPFKTKICYFSLFLSVIGNFVKLRPRKAKIKQKSVLVGHKSWPKLIFLGIMGSQREGPIFFFIFLELSSFLAEFKAIFRFFEFFTIYPLLIHCEAASHSFWSIAPFFFIELENMINLLISVISSK